MSGRERSLAFRVLKGLASFTLAAVLCLAVFLVLPLMQTIGGAGQKDLALRSLDVAALPPPPPPPPEQEPEPEEETPEEPPELLEEAPPLDLAQLELALDPGFGGTGGAEFALDLTGQLGQGGEDDGSLDEIFSLAELDQRPRVVFQRVPSYPVELKRTQRRGTVYVVFIVDERGKVTQPKVEKSTDPGFDRAALDAVKQWRFEPGTRNGTPVSFKMRIPITFNAS